MSILRLSPKNKLAQNFRTGVKEYKVQNSLSKSSLPLQVLIVNLMSPVTTNSPSTLAFEGFM